MLRENGCPKAEVCSKLVELLRHPNTLVAAYNAHFDLSFLYYFLKSYDSNHVLRQIKMLDAMTIYKDRRDYPHKLSDAVSVYELVYQSSHRAIDDAKATFAILVAMDLERDDLVKYVNLFGFNPKYGVSGSRIASVTYLPQGFDRRRRLYEN
jgi:DNA polymerase-3 subunit epsilon